VILTETQRWRLWKAIIPAALGAGGVLAAAGFHVDHEVAVQGALSPQIPHTRGLAGYAGEWAETAACLIPRYRVIAPDQRGHGDSDRKPHYVSRNAFVRDAEMWIEELVGGPANVIGQSLGGHTAFLLAARRPDLVASLIVAEASPASDAEAASKVSAWLRRWPTRFADEGAAIEFFGGSSTSARVWARGLERRSDVPISYRNAGDKPWQMAALSGTRRIRGAISERGAVVC